MNAFSVKAVDKYLKIGRDKMVVAENPPTLTIAKEAFGDTAVKLFLKAHIVSLADFYGVSGSNIDTITEALSYKMGDLKTTEVMLFFQMMKEGYFGEDGRMMGRLDGSTISTCLYRFRNEYRVRIIDHHEDELRKRRREEEERKYEDYITHRNTVAVQCFENEGIVEIAKSQKWLKEKDMAEIEDYIKERKMLRLLKERTESLVKAIESGEDYHTALGAVKKGITYIDTNFPSKEG